MATRSGLSRARATQARMLLAEVSESMPPLPPAVVARELARYDAEERESQLRLERIERAGAGDGYTADEVVSAVETLRRALRIAQLDLHYLTQLAAIEGAVLDTLRPAAAAVALATPSVTLHPLPPVTPIATLDRDDDAERTRATTTADATADAGECAPRAPVFPPERGAELDALLSSRMGDGFAPSVYQRDVFGFVLFGQGHGLVQAVAGSGKTTTLVKAAKLLTEPAVFFAFNTHIAEELTRRLSGTPMSASTIHSFGNTAVKQYLGGKMKRPDARKYTELCRAQIAQLLPPSSAKPETIRAATAILKKLVDFSRLTLTDPRDRDAMLGLVDHFGIDCDDERLLGILIDACADVQAEGIRQAQHDHALDFTDMIWLPHVWNLPVPQFGWVFVDEAQDLNTAQRRLVMKACRSGGRMLFVGDPHQAIYGFAGADADSFWTIKTETQATLLPLSICYRCPKSVVLLAQQDVPEIEPAPDAPDGIIGTVKDAELPKQLRDGDLILCRLTAPLISQCLRLIQNKIAAKVRGRDIGKQLTDVVRQVAEQYGYRWEQFDLFLDQYAGVQRAKLSQREGNEAQLEALDDKIEAVRNCYLGFQALSHEGLCQMIEGLFSDDMKGVILSTIHRAKGLEEARVFILRPDKMPLSWPNQQEWEALQERNLRYVARTRAMKELHIIEDDNSRS